MTPSPSQNPDYGEPSNAEEEFILEKTKAIADRQGPRIMGIGREAELQSLTDKVGRGDPAKKHVFLMARALSFLQHVEACCTGTAQLGN